MTYKTNKIAFLTLMLGAGVAFAACSSDKNNNNTGPIEQPTDSGAGTGGTSNADGGSKGGSGNKGGGNTGGKGGGTAGGGNTGGSGNNADAGEGGTVVPEGGGTGGAPPTDSGTCMATGANGCFECTGTAKPHTTNGSEEFLNQCTNNSCIKFDNTAAGVPATLPTLP